MADLAVQDISLSGADVTFGAADAGGDSFRTSGNEYLHVKNGGGSSMTVTVDSTRQCDQGFDHDGQATVPAGEERLLGPFPASRFGLNPAITYSGVTSVTVAVVKLPKS